MYVSIYLSWMCVCVPQWVFGDQRTTGKSRFSPSTMWASNLVVKGWHLHFLGHLTDPGSSILPPIHQPKVNRWPHSSKGALKHVPRMQILWHKYSHHVSLPYCAPLPASHTYLLYFEHLKINICQDTTFLDSSSSTAASRYRLCLAYNRDAWIYIY